jgi:hypothetical protein
MGESLLCVCFFLSHSIIRTNGGRHEEMKMLWSWFDELADDEGMFGMKFSWLLGHLGGFLDLCEFIMKFEVMCCVRELNAVWYAWCGLILICEPLK